MLAHLLLAAWIALYGLSNRYIAVAKLAALAPVLQHIQSRVCNVTCSAHDIMSHIIVAQARPGGSELALNTGPAQLAEISGGMHRQ